MVDDKIGEESRSFVCVDPSGNAVNVIAARDVFEAPTGVRFGPWIYRTTNSHPVRPGSGVGEYVLMPGNIPLTTVDPEEPTE